MSDTRKTNTTVFKLENAVFADVLGWIAIALLCSIGLSLSRYAEGKLESTNVSVQVTLLLLYLAAIFLLFEAVNLIALACARKLKKTKKEGN